MKLDPHLKGLADILVFVVLRELKHAGEAAQDAQDAPKNESEQDAKSGEPVGAE